MLFFPSTFPATFQGLERVIESLELVQCVHIQYFDSLKNNSLKYLLIFESSCEEVFNSDDFVDIATAGRHHGLSAIYFQHNLFLQCKLEREVELHKIHIFSLNLPVM